jgi:hypothetical protein
MDLSPIGLVHFRIRTSATAERAPHTIVLARMSGVRAILFVHQPRHIDIQRFSVDRFGARLYLTCTSQEISRDAKWLNSFMLNAMKYFTVTRVARMVRFLSLITNGAGCLGNKDPQTRHVTCSWPSHVSYTPKWRWFAVAFTFSILKYELTHRRHLQSVALLQPASIVGNQAARLHRKMRNGGSVSAFSTSEGYSGGNTLAQAYADVESAIELDPFELVDYREKFHNAVTMTGSVGNKLELRTTPSGAVVTSFGLMVKKSSSKFVETCATLLVQISGS